MLPSYLQNLARLRGAPQRVTADMLGPRHMATGGITTDYISPDSDLAAMAGMPQQQPQPAAQPPIEQMYPGLSSMAGMPRSQPPQPLSNDSSWMNDAYPGLSNMAGMPQSQQQPDYSTPDYTDQGSSLSSMAGAPQQQYQPPPQFSLPQQTQQEIPSYLSQNSPLAAMTGMPQQGGPPPPVQLPPAAQPVQQSTDPTPQVGGTGVGLGTPEVPLAQAPPVDTGQGYFAAQRPQPAVPPAPGQMRQQIPMPQTGAQGPTQQAIQALQQQGNRPPPSVLRQIAAGLVGMTPARGFAPLIARGPQALQQQANLPAQIQAADLAQKQQQLDTQQQREQVALMQAQRSLEQTKEWTEIKDGAIDPAHPELGVQPAFYDKNDPSKVVFGNVSSGKSPKAESKDWQIIPGGAIDPKNPDLGPQPAFFNKSNPDEGIKFGNVPLSPKVDSTKEGELPLGKRIPQMNQILTSRYQVLHPNAPLPPQYTLAPDATQKDYDRVDKGLDSEEKAVAAKGVQDQTKELRAQGRQTSDLATLDRETARYAKPYEKSVADATAQLEKISDAASMIGSNNAEAQALGIPKVLTALVSGQGTGVRITQPELNMLAKARGITGDAQAFIQKLTSGKSLTPTQQQQLLGLLNDAKARLTQKQQVANSTLDAVNGARTRDEVIAIDKAARQKTAQLDAGKVLVAAPDGSEHWFDSQAQASAFKKLANIQ